MDNNSKLFGVILVRVLRERTSLRSPITRKRVSGLGRRWGRLTHTLTWVSLKTKETIGVLLVGFQYSQYYTVWLPWDLNLQRWSRRASKEWGRGGSVELGKGFLNAFLDQDAQYRKYQTKPDGNLSLNLVGRVIHLHMIHRFFFFIYKTRPLNCISCSSLL